MPRNNRAGFEALCAVCRSLPDAAHIRTADLTEGLTASGMTQGAAAGTIRRACEAGLLEHCSYGVYRYVGQSSENGVSAQILEILDMAVNEIDSRIHVSDLQSAEDVQTVLRVNAALQALTDSVRGGSF